MMRHMRNMRRVESEDEAADERADRAADEMAHDVEGTDPGPRK